jgi:putative ABC transport system substrate-binding protein
MLYDENRTEHTRIGIRKGKVFMKTYTRALILAMALLVVAGLLAACAPKEPAQNTGGENATKPLAIGAVQLVEHPALDAAYKGFVDGLNASGYTEGSKVEIEFQNAQGDANNLSTIADGFVSKKKDLIFAITTDATQSMASKTTEIPIVATAVTDYVTAKLVDSNEAPGGNVTGTSDMNPVAQQIDLALELVPEAQTVGFIYNSSEDNSVVQVDLAKKTVEEKGKKWTEATVTGVNDVQQAMASLVKKCEVIYIPTDNTLASSMAVAGEVATKAGVPIICGESNMVNEGGLATLGIDYYELGKQTAAMAVKVMEGADPATMPIEFATGNSEVTINKDTVDALGLTVPDTYADAVKKPETTEE